MNALALQRLDDSYLSVTSERAVSHVKRLLQGEGRENPSTSVILTLPKQPRRYSILELRGLGKEIWRGVEAQTYINELRKEWDAE